MKDLTVADVKQAFDKRFAEFTSEERSAFRQRFVIHDYEVFPEDPLLVTLDLATCKHRASWGGEAIREHLRSVFLRDDSAVLVGYNNKSFDNKLSDAILDGMGSSALKQLSDELVEATGVLDLPWRSGKDGRFRPEWVGRTFDIGFDIGQKKIGNPPNEKKIPEVGLKRWERLNGYAIHRSTVPFDKPHLTAADRREAEKYCLYDVCATAMLLLSDEAWNPCVNARRVLVDDYGELGVNWEMTKPRITSIVLHANEENYTVPKDWEDQKFILPREVRIHKNRDILRAYTEKTFGELRAMSSRKGGGSGVMTKHVCGIPHVYGVGGVHGCPAGIWSAVDRIWGLDAASLYPNMMRHYNYLSRKVIGEDRAKFAQLIDLRTKVYKPKGDKRAEGLKLVLNGGFGSMGFDKSDMYDPVNFCSVTILGQLLITDLLEKLERHIKLIQSNTDGVFFTLKDSSEAGLAECRSIVSAFEKRTHLEMEWTEFERMYQRDISNYVAREVPKPGKPAGSGKIKKKGTWYTIKHCTVVPYLYESRIYSALNDGKQMPTEGIEMERFAIELKRDKNSECFVINGRPDYREWLDVVPVLPRSPKAQHIQVICKDDGMMKDTLFDDADDLMLRKRRKATGCPTFCALAETVTTEDIDLSWYKKDKTVVDTATSVNEELFID